jgi:aryl-alcohol dehydrogenase-like predicted oxidoreductase
VTAGNCRKCRVSHLSRIGLGTVQLGANYGISNRDGRPNETEVAAILARAAEAGVGYLDTAASYVGGETLIGRHLPHGHKLRIVTKLPPIAEETIAARHTEAMLSALADSLERLRAARVHGVLIHHAQDLGKPGWQYLVDALHEARARGWTSRIGVSVYDASDLALVESRLTPDIVQLPFNALDHRLADSGWLARLHAAGVEVHARSLFLQGLLLMEPATVPGFFSPVSGALAKLRVGWAAQKMTPLSGCLRDVLRNADIDVAIVGVNRLHELNEIEAALAGLGDEDVELGPAAAIDPIYLDPRQWPTALQ